LPSRYRNQLRENGEQLATENGIAIEPLGKKNVRKEDLVQAVLAKRGQHPGLVAIFSAMELCPTYQPWHHKETGKDLLAARRRQVLALLFLLHR
jgi:hypothetical protein